MQDIKLAAAFLPLALLLSFQAVPLPILMLWMASGRRSDGSCSFAIRHRLQVMALSLFPIGRQSQSFEINGCMGHLAGVIGKEMLSPDGKSVDISGVVSIAASGGHSFGIRPAERIVKNILCISSSAFEHTPAPVEVIAAHDF